MVHLYAPKGHWFALVYLCAHKGSRVYSSSGSPVDWRSRFFSPARLVVVGFIPVRVGLLGRAECSSGFFGFAWINCGGRWARPVHSRSRGFALALLVVVSLIQVREGSLRHSLGSAGSLGLTWIHSCPQSGRRVNLFSRSFTLAGRWFIRVRSGMTRCRRIHSDSCGLICTLLKVAGYIQVRVGSFVRS